MPLLNKTRACSSEIKQPQSPCNNSQPA